LFSLVILFFGTVFIGYIFKDVFIGMGTDVWVNTLDTESYKDAQRLLEVEFLPIEVKLIPLIFTLLAFVMSILFYSNYIYIVYFLYKIFFNVKFFFFKKKNLNIKKIKVDSLKQYIGVFKFFF